MKKKDVFLIGLALMIAWPENINPAQAEERVTITKLQQAALPNTPRKPVSLGLNKSISIDLSTDIAEVVVSDPAIVEAVIRSKRRIHLIGKKIGQASISLTARNGGIVSALEVTVERSLAPVTKLIKRLVPGAQVQLETINDNIVVTGSVTSPMDATRIADIAGRFVSNQKQVLNMVTVDAKEQVLLRVKVVEMNRSIIKRLGINMSAALHTGSIAVVKLARGGFPLTAGTVPLAGSFGGAGQMLAGSFRNNTAYVNAMLQALERNGFARTLAEPNLTSVSGETAKFLAGGEYPIPVGSNSDNVTIKFKPFGVGLSFTPVVLSAGRISMKIATEVSELTNEGAVAVNSISVPALRVRRASSTLELPSGGSLVMAGLISAQTQRNVDGLPGLRSLPVIGKLFRSEEFARSESELVVIVTPVLVRASEEDQLITPGENDAPRSQNTIVTASSKKGTESSHLHTEYGFIIE